MFSSKRAFPLATMTIIALGCHKVDPPEVRELRWIETADPVADAKAALAKGDHRLRAIRGLGITLPGTDSMALERLYRDYGINEIEGTTDSFENAEHHRLNEMAYRYAEVYNRQILQGYQPIGHR